jgi:O-antigen ligase
MLTAFLIPCFRRLVALGIACMIIAVVTEAMQQARKLTLQLNTSAWLMLALFITHFIGLNFSDNVDQGLKEIEIKLSYFVYPLILFFGFEIKRRQKFLIATAFVLGCLLRIPISIADAWMIYQETGNLKVLSYEMLSEPYHPSYMALYQGASVLLMLCYFYNEKPNRKRQIILMICIAVSIVYISMLASRAGLISAVLFIVIGGVLFWKESTNQLERIFLTGACLLVLVASSILLPTTADRIEALAIHPAAPALPNQIAAASPATSSAGLRKVTWSAAWQVMLENPFGVGTANTEKALVEEYLRQHETKAAEKKLNAHNQFLQMGAEFGWPGLLLILGLFTSICRAAWRQGKKIMLAIVLLMAINCLVESMLEVQAGIVFFGLLAIMIGPVPQQKKAT